jgi:hypothetical protein
MAQDIADALDLGAPVSMTTEAAIARWGRARALYSLAGNSRVRSLRTSGLGWSPNHLHVQDWLLDHLADCAR